MRTSTREKTERKRTALPPGTLVYVGERAEGPAVLRAIGRSIQLFFRRKGWF